MGREKEGGVKMGRETGNPCGCMYVISLGMQWSNNMGL